LAEVNGLQVGVELANPAWDVWEWNRFLAADFWNSEKGSDCESDRSSQ